MSIGAMIYGYMAFSTKLEVFLPTLKKELPSVDEPRNEINHLLSPVPELSFLPAPYRGWNRASERRVQDNLHAHAQNEPIKITRSQPRRSR